MKLAPFKILFGIFLGLACAGLLPFQAMAAGNSSGPLSMPVLPEHLEDWIDENLTVDNSNLDPVAREILALLKKGSAYYSDPLLAQALKHYPGVDSDRANLRMARFHFVTLLRPSFLYQFRRFYHEVLSPRPGQSQAQNEMAVWPEGFYRHFYRIETLSDDMGFFAEALRLTKREPVLTSEQISQEFFLTDAKLLKNLKSSAYFQFEEAYEQLDLRWPALSAELALRLSDPRRHLKVTPGLAFSHIVRAVMAIGSLDRRTPTLPENTLLASQVYQIVNSFTLMSQDTSKMFEAARAEWHRQFPGHPYPGPGPDDCNDILL